MKQPYENQPILAHAITETTRPGTQHLEINAFGAGRRPFGDHSASVVAQERRYLRQQCQDSGWSAPFAVSVIITALITAASGISYGTCPRVPASSRCAAR
jgi:hypothetical protein